MRTVVILGSHPATREFVDYGGPEEIWTFNESVSAGRVPRTDGVFQLHAEPIWRNPANRNDPGHFEWLQQEHPFPIWMMERYPEVPSSRRYPLEELCRELIPGLWKGGERRQYFTSSVAYALALAIYLGFERIVVRGVEMDSDTEYQYQRSGVYFWLGVAIGRGIEVQVHERSQLFDGLLYGYQGDVTLHENDFASRSEELEGYLEKAKSKLEEINRAQEAAVEEAMAAQGEGKSELVKVYLGTIKKQAMAMMDMGTMAGAHAEVKRYLERARVMEEAAGTHLFSRQEFEQAAARCQDEIKQREAHMHVTGAQAQNKWNELQTAGKSYTRRHKAAQEYVRAHEKYLQTAYMFGTVQGTMRENLQFLHKVDEMVKAAGGSKSEAVLLGRGNGHG